MTTPCAAPPSFSELVAYWARDLADSECERLEEHLMGCAWCTERSAGVAQLSERFRSMLPPVLSSERVRELRAQGLMILDNPMAPGERREVAFPKHVDILLHRLGGLELAGATRVSFALFPEGSERALVEVADVPFDRERGEILVACQQHYADLPPDTVARVQVHTQDGAQTQTTYTILHHYL